MAQLTINKNLSTQKVYEIDNVYEHILDSILMCSKNYKIEEGQEIPTIPVPSTRVVTTLSLTDGDVVIPINGSYNYIEEFQTNYDEANRYYSYSIKFVNKTE